MCGIKIRVVLVLCVFFNICVVGQVSGKTGRNVHRLIVIDADKKEITQDKLIASGNVEAHWDVYRIYADYLEYHRETNELTALGRITMTAAETVISGERFRFNLEKRTGEMYETYGLLSPTTRYATEKLTQENKETMRFKKLDFTPCAQCTPRWKITCTNGKIKKEKYIDMRNLLFKVKDFPVFYWPYLRYPITQNGRATGFLMPQMGNSSTAGFFMLNAFYMALKPNVDLTVNFDYYARAGNGIAQELRYLYPHMAGNIQFYLFQYKEDFTVTDEQVLSLLNWEPRKRDYFFKMKQQNNFTVFNIKNRLTVDIDKQSDPNFQRILGGDFDTVSNRLYRSSVSWTGSYGNIKLSMTTSQNDTYSVAKNRTTSKRYLPGINLNLNQQKLGKLPGYISIAASFSAIHKILTYYGDEEGTSDEETEEPIPDLHSGRFNIAPSYTVNLIKAPWLSGTFTLKSSYSFYNHSLKPDTEDDKIVPLDEPLRMDYQKVELSLKGPVFSRIFDLKSSRIKHLVEPKIVFVYADRPDSEIKDRLIVMDSLDRYSSLYSSVQFSLNTRLLYKANPTTESKGNKYNSACDILSYTITQTFYMEPSVANPQTIDGVHPQFSNLSNVLRFKPLEKVSLDATLNYNHYLDRFVYFKIDLGFHPKESPITGTFRYIKRINPFNYEVEETLDSGEVITKKVWTETVGGGVNLDIKGFPLKLTTRLDYDIFNNKFVNGSLGIRVDYQCVVFNAGINVFDYLGQTRTRFDMGVTFGNLGMVRNLLAN